MYNNEVDVQVLDEKDKKRKFWVMKLISFIGFVFSTSLGELVLRELDKLVFDWKAY